MEEDRQLRVLVRTSRRNRRGKLALQTAIIHLCSAVTCIIIGVFSMTVIKSKTIERVYGLPLWLGVMLLLTGFSGIQCHVKKTKVFGGLYMVLSLLAMFSNLIGIAWLLSSMNKSEVDIICLVCVFTFDMGIACLSTALGCNLFLENCKLCKHRRTGRRADESGIYLASRPSLQPTSSMCGGHNFVNQNGELRQERVQLTTLPSRQAPYSQQLPADEPPPYSEAIEPPPPYSGS